MNTNGNNRVKEQEKTSNVCEKTSNVYENMGRSVYVINFFLYLFIRSFHQHQPLRYRRNDVQMKLHPFTSIATTTTPTTLAAQMPLLLSVPILSTFYVSDEFAIMHKPHFDTDGNKIFASLIFAENMLFVQ